MTTYKVEARRIAHFAFEVEAESPEEALQKTEDALGEEFHRVSYDDDWEYGAISVLTEGDVWREIKEG